MSILEQSQNFPENRLLAALPQHVYESLLPHLSPVQLVTGQVVYEPLSPISYCYFLNKSLISCMSVTEQGASVAVGFVGKEGMLGAASLIDASLLPYRIIVQIAGSAMSSCFTNSGSCFILQVLYLRTLGIFSVVSRGDVFEGKCRKMLCMDLQVIG